MGIGAILGDKHARFHVRPRRGRAVTARRREPRGPRPARAPRRDRPGLGARARVGRPGAGRSLARAAGARHSSLAAIAASRRTGVSGARARHRSPRASRRRVSAGRHPRGRP